MTGEVLVAMFIGLGTVIAGAITAWRRAPSDNISILKARIESVEKDVSELRSWQISARRYIHALLARLADHDIEAPPPPTELDID